MNKENRQMTQNESFKIRNILITFKEQQHKITRFIIQFALSINKQKKIEKKTSCD